MDDATSCAVLIQPDSKRKDDRLETLAIPAEIELVVKESKTADSAVRVFVEIDETTANVPANVFADNVLTNPVAAVRFWVEMFAL